MMNIQEAIAYIKNFTWSTSRLGLERITELLYKLDNPQKQLKFIHIAGSNGKGSTCAMIESVLRCAGYKTGLYTSPYIEDFKESFLVCGKQISDDDLCRFTEMVSVASDSMSDHPSQFEIKTAIAMLYFESEKCDIIILETGLGGEFDSTNVIDAPLAAVITNIGYEHTEYLGNTIEMIARAKSGIIKKGSAVITYDNIPEALDVIKKSAENNGCTLYNAFSDIITPLRHNLCSQSFLWDEIEIEMPLLGKHQLKNAAVALKTIEVLNEKGYFVSHQDITNGFKSVVWPARFEVLRKTPLFILDGGHNEQCAAALADTLSDYLPLSRFVIIFGVLKDKNYNSIIDILSDYAESFVCVTPDNPRALHAEKLRNILLKKNMKAVCFDNIKAAVKVAYESGKNVLSFGSLYLAGAVRKEFRTLKNRLIEEDLNVRH